MSAPLLRRAIHSDRFPKPVASYSQGFQVGNTLYITGQLPVDPVSNTVVGNGDIREESRQVMRNLMAVLEEAGFRAADVVSATVYLTDINSLDSFDGVWQEYFPAADAYPSRAVVQVAALVLGIQLEISAIAVKD
ncbi:MAG: Rid family detoxifying hydrolase [Cyanobium sp.]